MKITYHAATPSATPAPSPLSEAEVRGLVEQFFPPHAVDRFMAIVRCENRQFDPTRIHVNKDGSRDWGLAQINDRWHRARVEKLFGESFEEAMSHSRKNLEYAALKWREEGFRPWTCNRLV